MLHSWLPICACRRGLDHHYNRGRINDDGRPAASHIVDGGAGMAGWLAMAPTPSSMATLFLPTGSYHGADIAPLIPTWVPA
jgi:hypothetical protein